MRMRRLMTVLYLLPTLALQSAAAQDSLPSFPAHANDTVSWWTLLAFLVTWGGTLYGAYWTVRKNRAHAEAAAQRQARDFFVRELDEEVPKKKMAEQRELWVHSDGGKRALSTVLTPLIDDAVEAALKEHDGMAHAHGPALARYVSVEQFNGGMVRMEALIDGLRVMLSSSEQRQAEGIREVKHLIRESNDERRSDFRELKQNVAATLGAHVIT